LLNKSDPTGRGLERKLTFEPLILIVGFLDFNYTYSDTYSLIDNFTVLEDMYDRPL
jgi:hypothetical protein